MTLPYNFGWICIERGSWQGPKLLHFLEFPGFFFRFFFNEPTAQTAWPIFVVNGSNNVVPCKVIAFGVHIYIRNSFGGHFPQKPPFSANRTISRVARSNSHTDQTCWPNFKELGSNYFLWQKLQPSCNIFYISKLGVARAPQNRKFWGYFVQAKSEKITNFQPFSICNLFTPNDSFLRVPYHSLVRRGRNLKNLGV